MPTEQEIKANYKQLHDVLSESYYDGTSGLTKEEFDFQHGQIWNDMEALLIVEGYITPSELVGFTPSNPTSAPPVRIEHIEDFLGSQFPGEGS